MAPRLSAGKKVSALTIKITKTSSEVNRGVVTGNVPADSGTNFLLARLPAIARIGMTAKKRPSNMAKPSETLYQRVFALRPPKAEPLLPVPEV